MKKTRDRHTQREYYSAIKTNEDSPCATRAGTEHILYCNSKYNTTVEIMWPNVCLCGASILTDTIVPHFLPTYIQLMLTQCRKK